MSRQSELAELSRVYDSSALSNRNLVINGAMQINQRGSQTVNSSDGDQFGPDRFRMIGSGIDQFVGTIAQDSDSPTGFGSSFKLTTTTAETAIDAAEYFYVLQSIEANTLQALKYGTSSAEKVTLSFHVKSSVTGTFGITLYKVDNTSQIQTKTYTISSASTWEYKTVTFDANTLTGGAINNDTGEGLQVAFHLAAGSNFKGTDTSSGWANYSGAAWAEGHAQDGVITTLNATWQITGVQLEIGDTATPFEHRSVGDELARCQRYFNDIIKSAGSEYIWFFPLAGASLPYRRLNLIFPVEMRATPSLVNGAASVGGGGSLSSSGITLSNASESTAIINGDIASSDDVSYTYLTRAQLDAEIP